MVELRFWSRPLCIFVKVYEFIVCPYLDIEVAHEVPYFCAVLTKIVQGWIAQIENQINSWVFVIVPVVVKIKHNCSILPVGTYYSEPIPWFEKSYVFIIKSKIRLFTPLNRDPSPRWVISIVKIKVLLLEVHINILKQVWNILETIDQIPIQVSKQIELSFIVLYGSKLLVICILINILDVILSVAEHHIDLHSWVYNDKNHKHHSEEATHLCLMGVPVFVEFQSYRFTEYI